MINVLKFIDQLIEKISIGSLIISLFTMLILTVLSTIFRWFNSSMIWSGPLIDHLVFLSAFLGGIVAAGEKQHITIDIFHRFLEDRDLGHFNRALSGVLALITVVVLCMVIFTSLRFVQDTFQFEGEAFLGIHRGFLTCIIPVGFSLLAYRFFYIFVESFCRSEKP